MRHIERQAEGYLELGMAGQALDALARLGETADLSTHGLYLQGEALRQSERHMEAVVPLEQAAQTDPGNIHIWLALGWCHKRTGRLDQAIDDLQQALAADPAEALVHYNLACYLSLAGVRDRALAHLAQALTMEPLYRELVHEEPDFDPIRSDPDFQGLTGIIA
jgi:tetratricopeptide (TPR) repeat protein